MAFKKITQKSVAPESPDLLFRELPRRRIPDVLPHQQSTMIDYASQAVDCPDVAMQLPTGSGKTLVGLLIGEWRRRKFQERVLYLCPTKQLVHQAVAQADQKYGMSVVGFTGSKSGYDPNDVTRYRQADAVAVTTYSSLFNTNSFFNDADILIFDDSHAAENYLANLWSLNIGRLENPDLHNLVSNIIKPHVDGVSFSRLTGNWEGPSDAGWVDKLATSDFMEIKDELIPLIDAHSENNRDLMYKWSMIRNNLSSCHFYIGSKEFLIRPLIPPTSTFTPFSNPKQRIYMSATLGEGGDLERLFGRKTIKRLPVPKNLDTHGVGRRFFMFPTLSISKGDTERLRRALINRSERSVVLVPNTFLENYVAEEISTHIPGISIFKASDIEESKAAFTASSKATAVIANRYDGIDFPGDECRLLFIEGLPKATNLQEHFLMSRMGANNLYNERVQARVMQAIGRCTRSMEDYSAIVVTGEELPEYLSDPRKRDYLHPELQAEVWFGVEQSKQQTIDGFVENYDIFIENGEDWESVNQEIVEYRSQKIKKSFPGISDLEASAKHEIRYQEAMWHGDYVEALNQAETIISLLKSPDLKGYRAQWEYLAGSAAHLACSVESRSSFDKKAREHFRAAKKAAPNIAWLARLTIKNDTGSVQEDIDIFSPVDALQLEKIELMLEKLGTMTMRKFDEREKQILEGLRDPDKFENAHKMLGEHLGFDAYKVESDASPDPWWVLDNLCIVFEDHAGAHKTSSLSADKARQASTHPNWIRQFGGAPENIEITPVLVTPVKKAMHGAIPHLHELYYWDLDEFCRWARSAVNTIREIRKSFVEPGDLAWRAQAGEVLQQNRLTLTLIVEDIRSRKASDYII